MSAPPTLNGPLPKSKRWDNQRATLATFVCHYNYCRKQSSFKHHTPAMAYGLTTDVWSVRKILETVTQ